MSERNFLGMKVEGDIYASRHSNTPQLSEEEVTALFAAVIGQRKIKGIAWTQYTPYFNDGDVCEFSIGDLYFAIEGADHRDSEYFDYGWMEDDFEENGRVWLETWNAEFKTIVGSREGKYEGKYPNGKTVYTNHVVDDILYWPIFNLISAVGNGSCNSVLLGKFGDHATIIIDVVSGTVQVDEYEHD